MCRLLIDMLTLYGQIKPWKMEDEDTALLDLLPFLEAIWTTNVADVREVVRSYQGQDITSAFRCLVFCCHHLCRFKHVQSCQTGRLS